MHVFQCIIDCIKHSCTVWISNTAVIWANASLWPFKHKSVIEAPHGAPGWRSWRFWRPRQYLRLKRASDSARRHQEVPRSVKMPETSLFLPKMLVVIKECYCAQIILPGSARRCQGAPGSAIWRYLAPERARKRQKAWNFTATGAQSAMAASPGAIWAPKKRQEAPEKCQEAPEGCQGAPEGAQMRQKSRNSIAMGV